MRVSKGTIERARKKMVSRGTTSRHWAFLGHWKFPDVLGEDGEVDLDATVVSFAHIYGNCPIIAYEWAGRDMRWVVDNKRRPLCPVCQRTDDAVQQTAFMKDVMMVGQYEMSQRGLTEEVA